MEAEFLSLAQIVQVMQETTVGVRIVKSFNLEPLMRSRMHMAVSDVEKRANSIAALEAGTSPIMETLAGLAIAGVVLVSGYLVIQAARLPAASWHSSLRCCSPTNRPSGLHAFRVSLEAGLIGVRMMFELADRPLTLAEKPGAEPLAAGAGQDRAQRMSASPMPRASRCCATST